MLILGFAAGHDGSACLVEDGRLLGAIANERLSRRKKAAGVTGEMVAYLLNHAGKQMEEIDLAACGAYYYEPDNYIKVWDPASRKEIKRDLHEQPLRPARKEELMVTIGGIPRPGVYIPHHMCHTAAAFFTSPFKRAACFSMDASAIIPEACSLFAYGQGETLSPLYCPGLMVGNAYNDITEFLGLGPGIYKAGSTMGLAAYGTPSQMAKEQWRLFGGSCFKRPFQDWDPTFIRFIWSSLSHRPPHAPLPPEESDSQVAMDLAASLQYLFTRTIVEYAGRLERETRAFSDGNLCLAGGSFLNCDANMAVREETPFQNTHLFPACGDDGTAVGAALYMAHTVLGMPRRHYEPHDIAYLGREYETESLGGEPLDLQQVAETIAAGQVVAWFQGRSEFGPRALGNRSLLADPRHPEMRDIINQRIKHREWFRPFAPSVLREKVQEWFHFTGESPFMLFVAGVKQPEKIPAVTHVDQTARVQTVAREDNPRYYDLIAAFEGVTGVPMLLNTSFNGGGQPLVESPQEALDFFFASDPIVSLLVLGERMHRRAPPPGLEGNEGSLSC